MRNGNISVAELSGVCGARVATVFCATHWKLTKVTAIKSGCRESYTKLWDIVECALRPEGEGWCDKRCFGQIDEDVRPRLRRNLLAGSDWGTIYRAPSELGGLGSLLLS
jgi:hypothetical protein